MPNRPSGARSVREMRDCYDQATFRRTNPSKPRDSQDDGPFSGDWESFPAIAEQAYRRGFAQGAARVLREIRNHVPLVVVQNWLQSDVQEWRWNRRMWAEVPPDLFGPANRRGGTR